MTVLFYLVFEAKVVLIHAEFLVKELCLYTNQKS